MMIRLFAISFAVLISTGALAADNKPLVISKIFSDGEQFVFERQPNQVPKDGITIIDPQTGYVLYQVKVTKCGPSKCLGRIEKNLSGLSLSMNQQYTHAYNGTSFETDKKVVVKKEEKIKQVVEKKPVPKKEVKKVSLPPVPFSRILYLGYGSPLGPGFTLGYFKKLKSSYQIGALYSNISSTTSDVTLKGHLLGIGGRSPQLTITDSIKVDAILELGMLKSTLDFSAVNPDGPSEDEMTYLAAGALEFMYLINHWAIVVKTGVSKNGQKSEYTSEVGNKFRNPYTQILLNMELGVYYAF